MKKRRRSTGAKFQKEWREFLALLAKHRARFLIVGAHALAALGRPRHTGDLDIFVEPSPKNAARVHAAVSEFGFGSMADRDYWSRAEGGLHGVQMGVEPLRIDVIKDIPGITFAEAWRGRRRVKMGGRSVYTIGRAAYLKNKRTSTRTKDLLDIALLESTPKTRRSRRRKTKRRRSKHRRV